MQERESKGESKKQKPKACECGAVCRAGGMKKHKRTAKHMVAMEKKRQGLRDGI